MAWNMAEPAIIPGVTNRAYGRPSTSSTSVPIPVPMAIRTTNGSTKYQVKEDNPGVPQHQGMTEPYPDNTARPDVGEVRAARCGHHSSVSFLPATDRNTSSRLEGR